MADRVDAVLQALNVDRVCVGHTAHDSINSVFDGKVWRLDTGAGILSEHRFSSVIEPWCRVSQSLQVARNKEGIENVSVLDERLPP